MKVKANPKSRAPKHGPSKGAKVKKDKVSKKKTDRLRRDEAARQIVERAKADQITAESMNLPEIILPEILVETKQIEAAVAELKQGLEAIQETKKSLFYDEVRFGLQVSAVKIPSVPSRNARIDLTHSLHQKGDEICLIVTDLKKGRKEDYEPTIIHWKELLEKLGIDYITRVIPFNQLKQDYRTFELKIKLAKQFDKFVADARISGNVFNFLGSQFTRRNKNPVPVKLEDEAKIKYHLDKAMKKITYKQVNKGSTTAFPVGTFKMTNTAIVENAECLINQLKTEFPGGWANIRTMYLIPLVAVPLSFPLYLSTIDPNTVPVPVISGPREKFVKKQNVVLEEATSKKYKIKDGVIVKVPKKDRGTDVKMDEAPEAEEDSAMEDQSEPEDSGRDSDDSTFNDI